MLRYHTSIRFHCILTHLALLLSLATWPAQGADTAAANKERQPTRIELSGEATVMAANDLAQATVFAEASGTTPGGTTAQKVKEQIKAALAIAQKYPQVTVRSSGLSTYPDYSSKLISNKSWRLRAELFLETSDMEALSALVGELQETLGVVDLSLRPAPETRKKAENEAILKAMTAFKERAALMAGAMSKPYRITHLALNGGGPQMIPLDQRDNMSMTRVAESGPMPIKVGQTQIRVTIGGTIELLD